eukprot:snap_masked-scaffold_5-processed-gene-11.1-mRNA-1 protein AED:0.04 eAED:0.04 QI:0/-1/0/1/-1/1/1/0/359
MNKKGQFFFLANKKYLQKKVIGNGSFGSVSLVKRLGDDLNLVCKTMCFGKLSVKEKRLIVTEVNLLREVNHPCIVRYYDRFIDKDKAEIHVFMEYCRGGDLRKKIMLLKRSRANGGSKIFAEGFVWKVLGQVVMALKYIHELSPEFGGPVIHRDIKPANILLDAEGNCKLADFGLAKHLATDEDGKREMNFARTVVGTPFYLPPEIVSKTIYNHSCDLWSLGCVIHELCNLGPPFKGEDFKELSKNILKGYPSCICSTSLSQVSTCEQCLLHPGLKRYSNKIRSVITNLLQKKEKRLTIKQLFHVKELQKSIFDVRRKVLDEREHSLDMRERQLQTREKELQMKLSKLSTGTSVTIDDY